MGVNGLWQLLTPVARPVAVETLGNRRLAIDTSLWIYQFQMSMRDKKSGEALQNAHIMGTFRRVMKLMYHGIKPVFVFDGDAPAIKKRTIAERKKRKSGATRDLSKTAAQLLSAQLRAAATDAAVKRRKELGYKEPSGKQVQGDVVYFDDLEDANALANPRNLEQSKQSPTPSPPKKKFVPRDQYALPHLDGPLESRAKPSDPRIATEEELRTFIEELRPEDFDVDSSVFGSLPTEVKYEILGELRIKSRQVNRKRVELMRAAPTALDFSKAQIANVMERNSLTQKLLSVTDELGQAAIPLPQRVAGARNKQYILVKQSIDKGGGWVLGVQDPVIANNAPVVLDTTSDESVTAGTDSDEFEEVEVPSVAPTSTTNKVLPHADAFRKQRAMDAIQAKYSPQKSRQPEYDPLLDEPFAPVAQNGNLFAPQNQGHQEQESEDDFDFVDVGPPVTEPQPMPERSAPTTNGALRGQALHAQLNALSSARLTDPSHPLPAAVKDKPFEPGRATRDSGADDTDEGDFEEVQVHAAVASDRSTPPAVGFVEQRQESEPVVQRDFAFDAEPKSGPDPTDDVDGATRAPADDGVVIVEDLQQPLRSPSPDTLAEEKARQSARASPAPPDAPVQPQMAAPTLSRSSSSFEFDIAKRAFSATPAPQDGTTSPQQLDTHSSTFNEHVPSPAVPAEAPRFFEAAPLDGTLTDDESAQPAAATSADDKARSASPEQFFDDWEKSPTPDRTATASTSRPLFRRRSGSSLGPSPYEEDANFSEQEEIETMENLVREEAQYADMMSMLKNRNLQDMRDEARDEVARLTAQRNEETRNADGATLQMSADIKAMLVYFGIPFVDAPGEAEAECANLLSRNLVDGVVTDDSDVFLFGASRVYRNMFNDNKYVECYLAKDLERELGLDRDTLIQLQYLLGGDYTAGLAGVGPVLARELLIEFPGPDGLRHFRNWWMRVQKGQDTDQDTRTAWRRRFKKQHKELVLDESWPDLNVAKAFKEPKVSTSDEPFSWGGIDLDGLRHYLKDMLAWGNEKVDDLVLPLIKRQRDRQNGLVKVQGHLGQYFDVSAGSGTLSKRVGYSSERLQNVVQSWRRQQAALAVNKEDGDAEGVEQAVAQDNDEPVRLQVKVKKRAPRKTTATGAPRKRGRGASKKGNEQTNEGVEDDAQAEAEQPKAKRARKGKAAAPKRRKRGKTPETVSDVSD